MSIAFRITLIIVSVFTLLYMCKKVKQEKLQIEYSIFWTLFAIMLVLFSIFPQIADWINCLTHNDDRLDILTMNKDRHSFLSEQDKNI